MAEDKKQLHIEVKGKIATLISQNFQLVGGNSDYEVVFDFDEDWANYTVKTALFVYGSDTKAVVFEGNICNGVAVEDATICFIGVYADDIATTTPACVSGIRQSIRDIATGLPEAPEEDVYNQIMALLNRYINAIKGAPSGGLTGQVLKKNSDADYDYSWQDDFVGEIAKDVLHKINPDDVPTGDPTNPGSDYELGTYAGLYAEYYGSDKKWRTRLLRANAATYSNLTESSVEKFKSNLLVSRIPMTDSAGRMSIAAPQKGSNGQYYYFKDTASTATNNAYNCAVPLWYADERYIRANDRANIVKEANAYTDKAVLNKVDKLTPHPSLPSAYSVKPDGSMLLYPITGSKQAYTIAYREANGVLRVGEALGDDDAVNLAQMNAAIEEVKSELGGSSGGTGGGGKLYRHDITLDEWLYSDSSFGFSFYNSDPTSYESHYIEDDDGNILEYIDLTALNNALGTAKCAAYGYCGYDSIVTGVHRGDDASSVWVATATFIDGQLMHEMGPLSINDCYDTVTEITLSASSGGSEDDTILYVHDINIDAIDANGEWITASFQVFSTDSTDCTDAVDKLLALVAAEGSTGGELIDSNDQAYEIFNVGVDEEYYELVISCSHTDYWLPNITNVTDSVTEA